MGRSEGGADGRAPLLPPIGPRTGQAGSAANTKLLRNDMTRFSVTAGQVDSQLSRGEHPLFLQATVQHGFSNMLTGYGGVVLAGDYRGALAGVALNTKLGAFGADITVADAGLPGIDSKGASVRLSYARLIPSTGTNFTLAAYRYSSKGYWSMQNALTARAQARHDSGDGDGDSDRDHGVYDIARPRNSFQISVSQPLGPRWGSLYLTGSTQQYWGRRGTTTYYQAGYSNVFKGVGYSFSASRQSDSITGRPDNRFMLTLSFRAGRGTYAPNVTSSLAAGGREPFQAQTTLSGSLGADNLLNYGATYSYSGDSDSFGGTLQYQSRIANLTGGVGFGGGYTQQSLGVTGALLLHSGGVTLGPSWSDSMALVHVRGAKGARVSSRPGVRIDGNGYAIVPYLMPYVQNRVEIDPKGVGLDVELMETSQTVASRQGAVVKLEYASVIGRAAIIAGKLADGSNIPFGASAMSADGQVIGQAGQGGRIFVRGVDDSGSLTLTWGDAPDQRCRLDYRLPPPDLNADAIAYEVAEALCRTGEAKDPAPLIAERSK